MAEIDPDTLAIVRKVIFGNDTEPKQALPMLDAYQAGVLLEVIKDLLYQAYVRRGRLQQAMTMRRFLCGRTRRQGYAAHQDRSLIRMFII